MSELTGPGVSTCERHKSRASRQKSGRRRPMRRQSGFLAGNGERGPNLTAIFHPPVFPHGLLDFCALESLLQARAILGLDVEGRRKKRARVGALRVCEKL
jgi:hypothetical protein